MKKRKKVILHKRDCWSIDRKLALTDEQIDLLNWLSDKDFFNNDDWAIQVLDDVDVWEEV